MVTVLTETATSTPEMTRPERILARQRKTELHESDIWHGPDQVSLVTENPSLANEPLIVRKALAERWLLMNMPISIEPDQLLVGTFRAKLLDQPKLPNYATLEEQDRFKGKPLDLWADPNPKYVTPEEKQHYGINGNYGNYGHNTLDFAGLISKGFAGVRAQAEAALKALDEKAGTKVEGKRGFYRAIIISCETMRDWARRYVALAEAMAAEEADPNRAEELLKIAATCRQVPERPAASFREALQSYLLLHTAMHSIHFDGAMGRIDQCFYPLLQQDLDSGELTHYEAQELVDCFMLKINDCTRYWKSRWIRMGLFHNVVLAGQTRDGQDATNEVTYMVLDALRRLSSNFPTVSVRLHKGSPDRLLRACCDVMRSNTGAPAVYNDEVFVPALVKAGIPIEDARDYANDGCWETTIFGKTSFTYKSFSAAKSLEWVLTRGRGLPLDWKRALGWKVGEAYTPVPADELYVAWPDGLECAGPANSGGMVTDGTRSVGQRTFGIPLDTGDPASFASFEDLMNAMETQLDHQVRAAMSEFVDRFETEASRAFGVRGPNPLASCFIDDCMTKGRGYGDGGERYTFCGLDVCATATAADSLAAIQEFVYDKQMFSLLELIRILETNFEGAEDIRSMLVTRAPKYGNGDPAADTIATRLLNIVADSIEKYSLEFTVSEKYNLIWGLLCGTFEWAHKHGGGLGASADGRRASEPSSSNLGPSVGMAMHGPTAALRSYTSLPLNRTRSGAPLDLSMDGTTTAGEAGLQRLMGFLRSFVDLGGNIMTVTLTDGDTLRHAQTEPEKYRDLRVRLGGSQAYFVGLNREMQDYYIARVEQGFS